MYRYYIIFTSVLLLSLSACDPKEEQASLESQVVQNYSELVLANYKDTYDDAIVLQASIKGFLSNPTAESLADAKESWLTARESYGKTEAFRFYGGPIDDENGPEGQMNAWPLDEAYIDYVVTAGGKNINIINSTEEFPEISAELIASLNENGSETNISSGYHAIEFLLWGQDLSDGPGPGQRPHTDYVTDGTGTASHQERRATYLTEVTNLLVSDLAYLVKAWEPSANNYRATFTAQPQQSIEKIFSGLGKLSKGELAGERIFVAYDLQSKEDEHSCFSDNTHRDIVTNALGIYNVYIGEYKKHNDSTISGKSMYDLIREKDEDLANEIKNTLEQGIKACEAIQPPFDQEFKDTEGRKRIAEAIKLLREQGDLLAEAAAGLGFEFDPEAI